MEYEKQYKSLEELKSDNLEGYEIIKRFSDFTEEDEIEISDIFWDMRSNLGMGSQEISGDYYYNEYSFEEKGWRFTFFGKQYIKDYDVICDEDADEDGLWVINIAEEKEAKKLKTQQKKAKHIADWEAFFEGKSLEDIKSNLLKYKFPSKI